MKKDKKRNFNFSLPEKSILGFKILNCFQSSISAYFLLISILFINPFFGFSLKQITFGSLFNIIANFSFITLIINIHLKRKDLKKKKFFFLNTPLFIYLPISIYYLIGNIINLFSIFLYYSSS